MMCSIHYVFCSKSHSPRSVSYRRRVPGPCAWRRTPLAFTTLRRTGLRPAPRTRDRAAVVQHVPERDQQINTNANRSGDTALHASYFPIAVEACGFPPPAWRPIQRLHGSYAGTRIPAANFRPFGPTGNAAGAPKQRRALVIRRSRRLCCRPPSNPIDLRRARGRGRFKRPRVSVLNAAAVANTVAVWANYAGLSSELTSSSPTFVVFVCASNIVSTSMKRRSNSVVLAAVGTFSPVESRLF
jgi:hypothetical protein